MRIELNEITKTYPGCVANHKVDLSVSPGEIHALLGENGAGKSTLMKIIYGVVKPDSGTVRWQSSPVVVQGPAHARKLGIGMVFQHFSLFGTLTVAENIALGLPAKEAKDRSRLKARILDVSESYGMVLDPDRFVHTLSIGEQQRVEIVRCLLQDVKLLILDEPTSVLTPQEVDVLFHTLRQLASEGCSILFISHKLDEVKALCDSATVLRQGVVTGECTPKTCSTDDIARMMVGDETPLTENYRKTLKSDAERPFLQVRSLTHRPEDPFACGLKNVSLSVSTGEVVGIAGVAGNGQEDLLSLISGESLSDVGTVRFGALDVSRLTPEKRRLAGMAYVPEERLGRGAVPDMSLEDNTLLTAYQGALTQRGWVHYGRVRRFAQRVIEQFNVKTQGAGAQAKSLSGGNLQKFIIGREILQNPKLLVCSHPTWGVDIGAAILIRHALTNLRDQGAAILVVSEDLDELYSISDRLCAICDGRISPLVPTDQLSIRQLGKWMAGDFDTLDSFEVNP